MPEPNDVNGNEGNTTPPEPAPAPEPPESTAPDDGYTKRLRGENQRLRDRAKDAEAKAARVDRLEAQLVGLVRLDADRRLDGIGYTDPEDFHRVHPLSDYITDDGFDVQRYEADAREELGRHTHWRKPPTPKRDPDQGRGDGTVTPELNFEQPLRRRYGR